MVTEPHWIYQGRQQHGWFGHGTAPPEELALQAEARRKLDERSALVVHYAEAHMPYASRFSYARRMGEMGGLAHLQTAMRHWVSAADLHPEAFRRRFLGIEGVARLSRTFQKVARQVRDARYHLDLSEAAGNLADAAQQVGLDGWPRLLGNLRERAEDQCLSNVSALMSRRLPALRSWQRAGDGSVVPTAGTDNPLGPDPAADGEHSTFRRNENGVIHNYETHDANENGPRKEGEKPAYGRKLRYRGEGKPHGKGANAIHPPYILERKPGEGPGKALSVARPAEPHEIPRGSGPAPTTPRGGGSGIQPTPGGGSGIGGGGGGMSEMD